MKRFILLLLFELGLLGGCQQQSEPVSDGPASLRIVPPNYYSRRPPIAGPRAGPTSRQPSILYRTQRPEKEKDEENININEDLETRLDRAIDAIERLQQKMDERQSRRR